MPGEEIGGTWRRLSFGEIAQHIAERVEPAPTDGDRYVGLEHLDSGSLTVRRWGAAVALIGTKLRMRKGDILFARRNAYLRRVALAPHDGLFSAHGMVLRARGDVVLPEFLPFFMQSDAFMDRAVQISVGSLSPTINWGALKEQEFVLPPMREQRRIAELLAAIEALRNAYIRVAEALGAATATMVANSVETLAMSYPSRTLGELAEVAYGLTVNPERRRSATKVPYLRVANVARDAFDLTEIKTVGASQGDEAHRLLKGDVLVVEGHADAAQIGRAAVWNGQIPDMLHQNHLIRARCRPGLDPRFLCLLINSPHGRAYFRSHAKSSSGLNTINSSVVRDYLIPTPLPTVQAALVERVASIAEFEAEIASRRAHLEQIRSEALRSLEAPAA
jgi:type I restriction enzyme S subunit